MAPFVSRAPTVNPTASFLGNRGAREGNCRWDTKISIRSREKKQKRERERERVQGDVAGKGTRGASGSASAVASWSDSLRHGPYDWSKSRDSSLRSLFSSNPVSLLIDRSSPKKNQ